MTPRARARRRLLAGALLCGVLAPALLTGCAESVDPIERLGRKAAQKMPQRKPGQAGPSCGQAFRKAERVGTASPADPAKPGHQEVADKEPPPPKKRCDDRGHHSKPR
ncbi:hypothetical protein KY5_4849 [Streptomyces formicae]|uniref:Lipoprotein n=1 Tax=Streptomyces formicae TaxID=1616117 RepID=A0A291QED5_9ACTN|nr:hypothetical protein KY5_4849 [Streptomyces formicae]